jgi:hypothetical protein
MPAPQAIFIDTGILDRECYDFSSSRMQSFVTAATGQNKKLLLPLPTKLEIEKHIKEQTRQAIVALMKARERNPLLRTATGIPQNRQERESMAEQLRAQVSAEWGSFQTALECQELDCSGISIPEIMGWYSQVQPPFGAKKPKEFPDAFALAALRGYTTQSGQQVAVVSTDDDFRSFCLTVPALRFYPDLETLTSELVADADAVQQQRFSQAVILAQQAIPSLRARIMADFPDRGFGHALAHADDSDDVDSVVPTGCDLSAADLQVVGITAQGFTVAFRAEVEFTADVAYADPNSWVSIGDGDIMYLHRCAGNVSDTVAIHGSAEFATDWTDTPEVAALKIEDQYIWVRTAAPQVDDHGHDADDH